jgi:hypothetical protein
LPGANEPVEGKLGTGAPFVAGSGAKPMAEGDAELAAEEAVLMRMLPRRPPGLDPSANGGAPPLHGWWLGPSDDVGARPSTDGSSA